MSENHSPPPEAEYCKPCDDYRLPIDGDCPVCESEIGIPESETILAEGGVADE